MSTSRLRRKDNPEAWDERVARIEQAKRNQAAAQAGRESDVKKYKIADDKGSGYTYEASDMRMAITVHEQIVGTEVVSAELVWE